MSKGSKTVHGGEADWREVTEALNALGASISRASSAPTSDEDSRRHMRELAEGLAALAERLEDAAGAPASTPAKSGTAKAAPIVAEKPETVSAIEPAPEVPLSVLDAFQAAHDKFRAASEGSHVATPARPVSGVTEEANDALEARGSTGPIVLEQDEQISVTGSFKAVIAEKVSSIWGGVATRVGVPVPSEEQSAEESETSIQEWLYPEGAPETALQLDTELEPARNGTERPADLEDAPLPDADPGPEPAAGVAEQLDVNEALRIAHERFRAERKAAEEAAEKARQFAESRRRGASKHAKRPKPPSDDDATVW